jgi:large subunit ribosomal protein L23
MSKKDTAEMKEANEAEAKIVKSVLAPVQSEKAFFLSHSGTYMFKVPAKMSKQAILKTVADEFKVKVESVTVSVRNGKMTRAAKGKKRMPIQIRRPDTRFAYVRLAKGEKLPFFEEQEAAVKDAAKQDEKKGKK